MAVRSSPPLSCLVPSNCTFVFRLPQGLRSLPSLLERVCYFHVLLSLHHNHSSYLRYRVCNGRGRFVWWIFPWHRSTRRSHHRRYNRPRHHPRWNVPPLPSPAKPTQTSRGDRRYWGQDRSRPRPRHGRSWRPISRHELLWQGRHEWRKPSRVPNLTSSTTSLYHSTPIPPLRPSIRRSFRS